MMKILPDELVELIQRDYDNIAGIVVQEGKETMCEHYFHEYHQNDPIHIASVTKSITSVLVGIAIDQGLIQNVEQKVLDFFPEYKVKKREKTIQKVTIRHLLTMTAPFKFKYEPYTKVYSSKDWTKAVFDLLGGKSLSEDFKYTTAGLQVLSGILEKATGRPVREFADEYLFKPLDIKTPSSLRIRGREEHFAFLKDKYVNGWVVDPIGTNTAGWGLTLTTRDMAKVGQLYLNGGRWNNQQIISPRWVDESTKVHSQWGELSYGYLWWIIGTHCFAAIGDGGNVVYVNPEKRIVVAITSRFKPRAKDRIELIENYILHQFKK
ncbi:MAG: serine hydrolase [Bacteroidota bacterium]